MWAVLGFWFGGIPAVFGWHCFFGAVFWLVVWQYFGDVSAVFWWYYGGVCLWYLGRYFEDALVVVWWCFGVFW